MKGNDNPSKDSPKNLYSQSFMPTLTISMVRVFLFITFFIFVDMNAIWVAHDRNKDNSWKQSKPELLSFVSNLLFMKKFFPNVIRTLYVDDYTKKYLSEFGITSLFHQTNTSVLNKTYKINPDVFWAYSKILAQRATKGPTLVFDLDFRIFNNLNYINFFNYDVGAFSMESIQGKYYYSTPEHCLENIVIKKDFEWDNFAVTVCCLYIKDNDFKNLYCDWALDYMYQWSYNHRGDTNYYGENYILFSEQYMLAQLIKKYNKKVGVIINDFQEGNLPDYAIGLGPTFKNHHEYCFHYGNNKSELIVGSENYNIEVETIVNHANHNIHDKRALDILNRIANIDDNEGCFRKLDKTIR
jgi:hypothetical protein